MVVGRRREQLISTANLVVISGRLSGHRGHKAATEAGALWQYHIHNHVVMPAGRDRSRSPT
jgi:hypothetical protein